jgi:PAS domain S-box-containing protein
MSSNSDYSAQRYYLLYDQAPVAYLSLTSTAVITDVNHAGENLLSSEKTQIIGKPLNNFISVQSRPAYRSYIRQLCGRQCPGSINVTLLNGAGKTVPVNLNSIIDYEHNEQVIRMIITTIQQLQQVRIPEQ